MPLNDLARINLAFVALEMKGYETSTTKDCSTCAVSLLNTDKYVFYHAQDVENLMHDNIVTGDTFYIGWGEDGNLDEICAELTNQGFYIIKPESTDYRIGIK